MLTDATTNIIATDCVADYTRLSLIVPELCERDAAGIVSELSHALLRGGVVADVLPFYHAALNQELMANSAQECGLAFPHGRLSSIKQLQFAFGRTPQPVVWGGRGSWSVRFVFLFAVPATEATSYLRLLATLARMGQDQQILGALETAENSESIMNVLKGLQIRPR